jgi:uncharacterized protein (DUF488 family)
MTRASVFTIGFTRSSAEHFFERLLSAGVKKVVDVRLHNTSQLSGFAKSDDLRYLLEKIGEIKYIHQVILAPSDTILKAYKKEKGDWSVYEGHFLRLMAERQIEKRFNPEMLDGVCLLCSEDKPHHCHRRLVCEYLNKKWDDALDVHHL